MGVFFRDSERDGTPYLACGDGEGHFTFGYYSNNSWVDDDRIILSYSRDIKDFDGAEIWLADFRERRAEPLGVGTDGIVWGGDRVSISSGTARFTDSISPTGKPRSFTGKKA